MIFHVVVLFLSQFLGLDPAVTVPGASKPRPDSDRYPCTMARTDPSAAALVVE